jgi:hypothetical protein
MVRRTAPSCAVIEVYTAALSGRPVLTDFQPAKFPMSVPYVPSAASGAIGSYYAGRRKPCGPFICGQNRVAKICSIDRGGVCMF